MGLLSEFTKSYNSVALLLLVYQKHTIVGKCTVFVRKKQSCKYFIWEVFELIFKSLMFDWRRLIGNLANPSILWDIISSETLKDTCVRLLRSFSLMKHLSPFLVLCSEHEKPKYYWHTCRALTFRGVSRMEKMFSFSRRHVNSIQSSTHGDAKKHYHLSISRISPVRLSHDLVCICAQLSSKHHPAHLIFLRSLSSIIRLSVWQLTVSQKNAKNVRRKIKQERVRDSIRPRSMLFVIQVFPALVERKKEKVYCAQLGHGMLSCVSRTKGLVTLQPILYCALQYITAQGSDSVPLHAVHILQSSRLYRLLIPQTNVMQLKHYTTLYHGFSAIMWSRVKYGCLW